MFQFLSHFIGCLIQCLNFKFTRANVSLQFLDLIIKYELELFQLLRFLSEINNPPVFVFDGGITLFELTNLADDLLLQLVGGVVETCELLLFLGNFFLFLFLLVFLFLEVIMDQGQVAFGLHALINDLGKFFLILVLENINSFPSIIFNALSFFFVVLYHKFNFILQSISFLNLTIQLDFLILTQLLDDLFMI